MNKYLVYKSGCSDIEYIADSFNDAIDYIRKVNIVNTVLDPKADFGYEIRLLSLPMQAN